MKKNKRLILHIGTGKTGTTSIQDSLGRAREALLDHKIYYPTIQPFNHIFTFPPIFLEDPTKIDWFRQKLLKHEDKDDKIQGFITQWRKEFAACGNDKDFIISAEDLTLPFFDREAVIQLKKFVEPYFDEVAVIVYVRHYNSWIPSQAQQSIKNGFLAKATIENIVMNLQNCPPFLSYRENLQKWVDVFGREKIVVRPYDPLKFYNQSLLADFFHACNLPADQISIPELRLNESIGKNTAVFLQKYNQTYPIFENGSINRKRGLAREGFPRNIYLNLRDEKLMIDLVYSPSQVQKLNEEIDYVNQFFLDGYTFPYISPGEGETQVPVAENIPIEYFVELINNYNKRIEMQRNRIDKLRKENAYFQRVFDVLKIPSLLRMIRKTPFLKAFLRKIIC